MKRKHDPNSCKCVKQAFCVKNVTGIEIYEEVRKGPEDTYALAFSLRAPTETRRAARRLAVKDFLVREMEKDGVMLGTEASSQYVLDNRFLHIAADDGGGKPVYVELIAPRHDKDKTWTTWAETSLRAVVAAVQCDPAKMQDMNAWVNCVEDQAVLREFVAERDAVCFVANGSVLVRDKRVSYGPLRGGTPFQSPASFEVTVELPWTGTVSGMLLPRGVTIIAGGGFHGKSTLLKAIAAGAWYKRPGDGREFVVTDTRVQTVRAEDGRSVADVDITPFISNLPSGANIRPECFSTSAASGSTSQASNVIEAVHAGAKVLLVDEDTSAGNFLVRDSRMRSLIRAEPIVPFIYRVNGLHTALGVSTVVVIGGCGDWLDVHDTALLMENYVCTDVTKRARGISKTFCTGRVQFNGRGLVHRLPWPGYAVCSAGVVSRLQEISASLWIGVGGVDSATRTVMHVRTETKLSFSITEEYRNKVCSKFNELKGNELADDHGSYWMRKSDTPLVAQIDLSKVEEMMHDEMRGVESSVLFAVLWLAMHVHIDSSDIDGNSVAQEKDKNVSDLLEEWERYVDVNGLGAAIHDVESFCAEQGASVDFGQGDCNKRLMRPRGLEVWSALNRLLIISSNGEASCSKQSD